MAALCLTPPLGASASDDVLAALAERGFVPWASDFVGEFPYPSRPAAGDLLEGPGFLIRLPRPAQADRFLVANGSQSVIVDRVRDVGPVALSERAAAALGLPGGGGSGLVTLTILALAAKGVVAAPVIDDKDTANAAPPIWALPPIVTPDAAFGDSAEGPTEAAGSDDAAFSWEESAASPAQSVLTVPPVSAQTTALPATTGRLALQAGYFRVRANATRLAGSLRDRGLPVVEQQRNGSNGPGWLVLVGPFASNAERNTAKARGGALLKDAFATDMPNGL